MSNTECRELKETEIGVRATPFDSLRTLDFVATRSLVEKIGGASCQTRTDDLLITNQLLYQLS